MKFYDTHELVRGLAQKRLQFSEKIDSRRIEDGTLLLKHIPRVEYLAINPSEP